MVQGSILKIGTGYNNTIQGKVYVQKEISRQESQASWVHIKGKLYLKTQHHQQQKVTHVKDISKHGIPIIETTELRGKKTNFISKPGEIHEFTEIVQKNVEYGTQQHKLNFFKLKDGRGYIYDRDIPRDLDTLEEVQIDINQNIEVYDTEDLQKIGEISLDCDIFYENQKLINKNYQLMTNGDKLQILGIKKCNLPYEKLLKEGQQFNANTPQNEQILEILMKEFDLQKNLNSEEYQQYLESRIELQKEIDNLLNNINQKEYKCIKNQKKMQVINYKQAKDLKYICNLCNDKYYYNRYKMFFCNENKQFLCENCISNPINAQNIVEIQRNTSEIQILEDELEIYKQGLEDNINKIQEFELHLIQKAILKEKIKNTYLYKIYLYNFDLKNIDFTNQEKQTLKQESKVLLYERQEELAQNESKKYLTQHLSKISHFKFEEHKHQNLTTPDSCTIKNGQFEGYKFAILNPTLKSRKKFAFKMQQGEFKWTAIGICDFEKIKEQKYTITEFKEGHGLFVVINNGGTLSSNDPNFNNKFMSPFQFKQGDIILCDYNPEKNEIEFKKDDTQEVFSLKINNCQRIDLRICVLFKGGNQDEIQYIEKLEYIDFYKDVQSISKQRKKNIIQKMIENSESSFKEELKHENIKILNKCTIKSIKTNGYKLAVMDKELKERTKFAFKLQEGTFKWVALGICHLETVKDKNFIFNPHNIGHGAYMISQNAGTWSNIQSEYNNQVKAFKFALGNIIICDFDPENQQIVFSNEKNPKESYTLKIKSEPNNPFHVCVVLHFPSDEVQFIENIDNISYFKDQVSYNWQWNSTLYGESHSKLEWTDYNLYDNKRLNEYYLKGKKECNLGKYTVDFKNMVQYDIKDQLKQRKVRKQLLEINYDQEISNETQDCIWTSDQNNICLYNQGGCHIFSQDPQQQNPISTENIQKIVQKETQKADEFLTNKIDKTIGQKGTYIKTIIQLMLQVTYNII